MKREPGLMLFLLFPAVTMSLGWGLRGTIGGGSMGATIPGAMVALSLCLLLDRKNLCGLIAAFGAIGVGLGGQVTYGQTFGFMRDADTFWWGLTGLSLKGAAWGMAGGILIAMALLRRRFTREEFVTGLLWLVVGTVIGWGVINRPKLIYFSDRFNKPREEIWAGLILGALCLLGYLMAQGKGKIPRSFALWGAVFGAIGLGGGGLIIALEAKVSEAARNGWPWWKTMEFSCGFAIGLGLACACYRNRGELKEADAPDSEKLSAVDLEKSSVASRYLTALLVVFGPLWLQFHIGFEATFTVLGALLLLFALHSEPLAWQVGIGFTTLGFIRDFLLGAFRIEGPRSSRLIAPAETEATWLSILKVAAPDAIWLWVFCAAVPLVWFLWWCGRKQRLSTRGVLLALGWFGSAVAITKTMLLPYLAKPAADRGSLFQVSSWRATDAQLGFLIFGVLMTVMAFRCTRTELSPAERPESPR